MNATSNVERAALDAATLDLLFAHSPYIDWRNSDDTIVGAVWIDQDHPDDITASKRFAGKDLKRTFTTYNEALRWALDRSHA